MKPSCEENKILISAMIDNELPDQQVMQLNRHLVRCRTCREEYDLLCGVSDTLSHLRFDSADDARLDRIWRSPYSRLMNHTALIMIGLGWTGLLLFGIYEFFILENRHPLETVSLIFLAAGFLFLLINIIRNRMRTHKPDPYKEVNR